MTQIETIIAEIERLKAEAFNNIKNRSLVTDVANSQRIAICEQLLDFINSFPTEQPSEDLKKEIDRFQKAKYGGDVISVASIACHFANWQKEQMLKSAIDAKIVNDEMSGCVVDCAQGCLVLEPNTYPIGQKLKILIIKEDE